MDALDGPVLQGGGRREPALVRAGAVAPEWERAIAYAISTIELLRGFIAGGKPVLGICRGAQLINVAFGGTLWQDVATLVPAALVHYDGDKYDENFHEMRLEPASLLSRLFSGEGTLSDQLDPSPGGARSRRRSGGGGARRSGWADRGDPLAGQQSWVLGMQWHPEFHPGREGLLDCAPVLVEFLRKRGGASCQRPAS